MYSPEGQSFILAFMCQGIKIDSHVLDSEDLRFTLKSRKMTNVDVA